MHRLLKRQIRKTNLNSEQLQQFSSLFETISDAYANFDRDLVLLENILEKSSRELFVANQKLQEDIQSKSAEVLRTKKQLERVLSHVNGVIFETDSNGNYIFLNQAWEQLTGYTVEESLGKNYSSFMNLFNEDVRKNLESQIANSAGVFNDIVEATKKSGEKIWVEISFKLLTNEKNEIQGVIGSFINVTDLKNTEIELKQSENLLLKASQAKEDFLSTMSHEIRTPLNGVIGITNILLMEEHLESQKEHFEGLKFSSEHLLALINDILDYNKIESGNLDLEEADFNFESLLNSIKRNFDFLAAEKGIKFKIKRDDAIPAFMVGDSTRISQILNNLIGNAIKFTNEGQVVLDLEEITQSDSHIEILFQIKDTGIGIAEDNLLQIFEKFKQAQSDTTREYGGSGLGLSISKNLIELMNGELEVSSEVDKGSNFFFKLTFKKSSKFDKNTSKDTIVELSNADLSDYKILVAEDNKLNQHVIKRFLINWGAEFDIVANGEKAVDQFDQKEYDVILMDLQMPVMNGYDASALIKEKSEAAGKTIPIIALTASAQIDVKFKTRAIGMTGFITKPFDPIQLYKTIKSQVEEYA